LEDPYKLLEKWMSSESFLVVGREVYRVDSLDKALGKALFTEDYYIDYFLETPCL